MVIFQIFLNSPERFEREGLLGRPVAGKDRADGGRRGSTLQQGTPSPQRRPENEQPGEQADFLLFEHDATARYIQQRCMGHPGKQSPRMDVRRYALCGNGMLF